MKKVFTLFAMCLMLAGFSVQAQAVSMIGVKESHDITFQNQVETISFTIPYETTVYIFTNNSSMNMGLYLWDASGNRIISKEDGNTTSVTHWADGDIGETATQVAVKDAVIAIVLAAGDYKASVVPTFGNFDASNQLFRTLSILEQYRSANGSNNILGQNTTLNIVYQTPVPIPASALLLAPGLAALGVLRRKIS